jgi:ABC-type multidrug transport system fused ATPase/permease subunit
VDNVASFLESVVKSISAVGAMVLISPLLTMYSSAVVPAVLCGAMFYGGFIKRLSRKHLDSLATSTHIAAERFGAIATVLSFGQKNAEIQRYSSVMTSSALHLLLTTTTTPPSLPLLLPTATTAPKNAFACS